MEVLLTLESVVVNLAECLKNSDLMAALTRLVSLNVKSLEVIIIWRLQHMYGFKQPPSGVSELLDTPTDSTFCFHCIWFVGHPHQTLWQVTNWWTERAQVSWTSLAQDLSACHRSATSAPILSPRSSASVATSRVIPLAVQLWIAYRQERKIAV